MRQGCAADYVPSAAWLTLHLPPQSDVTAPETLTICREPECATGTLPAAPAQFSVATVMTTRPDVTGEMTVRTGDIRVLDIDWLLHPGDVNAADPRNAFTVMVTDAAGTQTGALAGEVTYAHVEGCGGESIWTAHLSD